VVSTLFADVYIKKKKNVTSRAVTRSVVITDKYIIYTSVIYIIYLYIMLTTIIDARKIRRFDGRSYLQCIKSRRAERMQKIGGAQGPTMRNIVILVPIIQ